MYQREVGSQSEAVSSLNHEVVMLFLPSVKHRILADFPKFGPKIMGVTVWGCSHITIYCTRSWPKPLHMYQMEVGSSLKWLAALTMKVWCLSCAVVTHVFRWLSKNWAYHNGGLHKKLNKSLKCIKGKSDPVWSSCQPQPWSCDAFPVHGQTGFCLTFQK